MNVTKDLIGKVFKIKNVPENIPCNNCDSCLRLRIMELGMYEGEMIEIDNYRLGLWTVNILGPSGNRLSKIVMRDDEMSRIILEDESCRVKVY